MATQFTSILKLALPVQGELVGSWGTVVNENITSMIEQAIAGLATINTWSSNSHTLTSANGTTSESRCAMLVLAAASGAPSSAASVVCPAATKTYIVKNGCGQAATVKTPNGSGIAVPSGKTMLLFCDGTNVVEAVNHIVTMSAGTLTIGAGATVTSILDEDNMASNSATALSTQQSIKAYVDANTTSDTLAEVLANGNTTTTTQKIQFRDTAIHISSSADGQLDIVADTEIQIAATTIDINGAINASGEIVASSLDISGNVAIDGVIAMGANTAGALLIANGTNFNPTTIPSLAEISTAATEDTFLAIDASGGGLKKITRGTIIAGTGSSGDLSSVVEDTSPQLGGNLDVNGKDIVTTSNATLDLAPNGTGTVVVRGNTNSGAIVFNCESNSHGQKVFGQPHSASVTNTLMLPAGANSTLVSLVSVDTLTNKTLTSPKINENVAVTSTATEINILDGVTSTTAELNILDGVTSTAAELNILDGATVVVAEVNFLDLGSTAVGTAIASKAVILDSNKDYTGVRNLTISGELDAATLDISGAIDVAGNSVLASVDVTGLATAATFEPDGATSAGDNAAIGYTSAEGLILTGQGSTNDVTIKNDADADVIEIPTGTVNVTMAGTVTATSTIVAKSGIHVKNGSAGAGFVQFFEDSDNGTNKVTLAGPASTADITLTLPSSAGVSGQALVTNGSGVLSFEAVGGGNVIDFVASGTLPNGKPVVLKSDGTIEVVASGGASTVISAGSPTVFESADSEWNSVTRLTDTTAIVTYRDNGNSGYGTACILTVSGSSITSGTPVVFESASTYYISVIRLTDTKALVAYQDRGNSSYGTSVILTISGTSISVGTPVVFESASTEYISADMLTATKAIVVYRDAPPTYGTACILTVSGTSITAVTPVVFESDSVYYPSVTALSATVALVAYYDAANSQNRPFTAAVLTVSGTSISVGTPANVTTTSGTGAHIAITTLSTTKALIAFQDNGNSGYGTAVVVTVSGTSISAGTPLVFESADTEYSSAATLTATKAMVVYRDNGNSNYGTSVILDVDNTSITKGTAVVFEAAASRFISLTGLTQYKALVAYEDSANSKYGTSRVLDNVVNTNLTSTNFVGMSTAAYTNGQTASVAVLGGISSNQTSLTIGSTYYVKIDGTLSTTADIPSVIAGKAVSATTLILKGL